MYGKIFFLYALHTRLTLSASFDRIQFTGLKSIQVQRMTRFTIVPGSMYILWDARGRMCTSILRRSSLVWWFCIRLYRGWRMSQSFYVLLIRINQIFYNIIFSLVLEIIEKMSGSFSLRVVLFCVFFMHSVFHIFLNINKHSGK